MTLVETHGLASMSDEAQLRWVALGDTTRQAAVVMLHGGPGLPDYLGDVAPMVADLAPVYRYDQRGTGRSPWRGRHSLARHVDDLTELLDAWDVPEAVLIRHSYGTDLASRFCLRHWRWAAQGARRRRPVNWAMNGELGGEGRADPLDERLADLRACLPARTELLGGAEDPRPVSALESLALRLDLPLTRIEGAGHEPWLEQYDTVRAHLRRFVQGSVGP
ncbi:alpha/beta hydrolase [Streptomyces roseus]|uniref:alpha/beta fold hydrolase n=1 Tax=Streptomyces roseus TaxID=66430 RepID=UPI0033CC77A9